MKAGIDMTELAPDRVEERRLGAVAAGGGDSGRGERCLRFRHIAPADGRGHRGQGGKGGESKAELVRTRLLEIDVDRMHGAADDARLDGVLRLRADGDVMLCRHGEERRIDVDALEGWRRGAHRADKSGV